MGIHDQQLILGVTAFERPDPAVVVGLARAGALGVLDLGRDAGAARRALDEVARWTDLAIGVRVPEGAHHDPSALSDQVDTVVLATLSAAASTATASTAAASTAATEVARLQAGDRRVLVEVRSVEEADAAIAAGADGLIAKGSESGGRIGDLTAYVLVQTLVARTHLPVWAQGGIGLHTAAAAVAGGATGVVLDAQLALVRESTLPAAARHAVGAMDGSETVVIGGHRVFTRPDLPVASADPDTAAADVIAALGADDLRTRYLPVGQDGAFAKPLADRFGTAGGVAQAIARAIDDHIAAAAASPPLGPDNRLAASLGTRYPIAQGPMTRVSDRAAFAASVAEAGGLPFLALALMSGPEVRELLEETAPLLGDRPWGVGILGFVPPEVREAQLEVVHDVRPPVALIAGGRPSQAAPLESAGITTYLHVPSPGLLDLFLKEGARKFVFEGRECGGHVGPRSSFALWDAQIEHLLAFAAQAAPQSGNGAAAELSVLFAGGIHDDRSAAMVGAMAAPLAEAGAGVGVLMGTAYLFTEEAVAGGAILPGFQDAAMTCERTVLLETSPGHATRCVESDYVRAFEAEKRRLLAEGHTVQEAWAELEQLNLGRLRIATKGVAREGGELVTVDEDGQRREGMFMIGQAATLRHEITTVAALHEQVSAGGSEHLAALADTGDVGAHTGESRSLDIAIIGMAGAFPGAADTAHYWSNVVGGVNAITEVPAARWDADRYYDPDAFLNDAGRKTPSRWGGFLPEVPFDALAYGIPPTSLSSIEPAQLLSLEMAARALADAGYATREFDRARTSVVFGAEGGTDLSTAYGFRSLFQTYVGALPDALDEHLPSYTEDSFPGLLTNVIAGRIANRLDLGGSNYTVDAACASALAAIDVACKELVAGTSDMVLAGGADLHNGVNDYLLFSSVHALSPSGQCRTFDADADGITLGEGVGCLVLKRLADAERDGDRIYGVLRGMAASSDGRHLGLTAPRKEGQRLALERAYDQAGVSPADVGLIEAHGTGTVVGDRTELATLTEFFSEADAAPGATSLGSVKSQIGHTKCAAGVAGLIKATEAVYRGVRPPTLNIEHPTDYYDAGTSPFRFDDAARPWADHDRVAGVSAFGFGGTNFHAVVASYDGAPGPAHGLDEWPAELFVFRGADRAAALTAVDALAAQIPADRPATRPVLLRDLARAQADRSAASTDPVQVAVVADDVDDLVAKLQVARTFTADKSGVFVPDEALAGEADGDAAAESGKAGPERPGDDAAERGRLAFLFPGQGSQRPGMLRDLFVAFPRLQRHLRAPYTDVMFPPAAHSKDETKAQKDAITDTRVAQPTLGIAGLAVHDLLGTVGVRPDQAGGHSYGELVALCAAGAIAEADLVPLSETRARAILDAAGDDPGAMAAVAGTGDDVRAVLDTLEPTGRVVLANDNAPGQAVISGPTDAVGDAVERLAEAGMKSKRLPVACAFHSPVVADARVALGEALAAAPIGAPSFTVWANTTAAPYPDTPDDIRALLAGQVAEPVRFVDQVQAMYDAGARVFVEAGPGRVLTQLVGKILGDRPHVAVACDASGDDGLRRFLLALAQLAVNGVDVDLLALFAGRDADAGRLTAAGRPAGWTINGHLVRNADGSVVPGSLQPVDQVPPIVLAGAGAGAGAGLGAGGERDAAVLEYLRGARELMAAEREVMLRYLGGSVEPAAPLLSATAAPLAPMAPMAPAAIEATATDATAGAPAAAPRAAMTSDEVMAAVLAIVSERTGYPLDMLDPDLDLEADLSIDSIKRIEIVGELADRVGLPGADEGSIDESVVEELAQLKTLRGIVDWIGSLGDRDASGAAGGVADGAPSADTLDTAPTDEASTDGDGGAAEAGTPADDVQVPAATLRYVVEVAEVDPVDDPPPAAEGAFAGRTVGIVDDGQGVALHLAALLEERGATVRLLQPDEAVGPADTTVDTAVDSPLDVLVHLALLAPSAEHSLVALFAQVREAVLAGLGSLVVATGLGGAFGTGPGPDDHDGLPLGSGAHGLARTVPREFPDCRVLAVDLDRKDDPSRLADHLLAEMSATDGLTDVGRTNGTRHTLRVRADELDPQAVGAAAPFVTADSVVLLTGGARGITARVAVALAREGCGHLELVGRSALPDADEDPATAGAADAVALRKALIGGGMKDPAAIEAACARILAEREVRATLSTLDALGVEARYHRADVRDRAALEAVVADVYARHGRLDGVVHGAGVLEDRFLRDKTAESFERVFGTKVDGARTLARVVRPDVGFVVLFGSIAGVFGNRGQIDYAAANDALDTLARSAGPRFDGRVVSVDWGPWAGTGMVSAELEREYARRGIGLIDPDDGVACLMRELRSGRDDAQVVLMRALPEHLHA